jgi:hypothetical protein
MVSIWSVLMIPQILFIDSFITAANKTLIINEDVMLVLIEMNNAFVFYAAAIIV